MKLPALALSCCALVTLAGCGGSSSTANTGERTAASITAAPASATGAPRTDASAARTQQHANTALLARYYGSIVAFGHEANGPNRSSILTVLHSYLSAIASGDWTTACSQLSAPIQHQLELLFAHAVHRQGCAPVLGALLARTPSSLRRGQAQLSIISIRTRGDRAVVLYRSRQFPHAMISMLREAGRWKAGVIAASNV